MTVSRYEEGTGGWSDPVALVPEFWPLQEPLWVHDRWVMAGLFRPRGAPAGEHASPAVVRSVGSGFDQWEEIVEVKIDEAPPYWGECALLVSNDQLILFSRYGYSSPWLLVSVSNDGGATWSPGVKSNLPFSASKPSTGRLSGGEPFIVGTSFAGVLAERTPLTVLLGPPEAHHFESVFVIDDSQGARLSYPYALELGDELIVAYSDDEGRGWNHNRLRLARLPMEQWR